MVGRSFDRGALKQRAAVVKRAYAELRERVDSLKRLAFWTIRAEEAAGASELFRLTGSKAEDIDVVMTVDEVDIERQQQALDCYVTYRETIERAGARRNLSREAVFEVYQETHDPPLDGLSYGLTRIRKRQNEKHICSSDQIVIECEHSTQDII